jgi:hypothetical protein
MGLLVWGTVLIVLIISIAIFANRLAKYGTILGALGITSALDKKLQECRIELVKCKGEEPAEEPEQEVSEQFKKMKYAVKTKGAFNTSNRISVYGPTRTKNIRPLRGQY